MAKKKSIQSMKKDLERERIIRSVVEWMYLNDGMFPNKNEWRLSFMMYLKGIIYSN